MYCLLPWYNDSFLFPSRAQYGSEVEDAFQMEQRGITKSLNEIKSALEKGKPMQRSVLYVQQEAFLLSPDRPHAIVALFAFYLDKKNVSLLLLLLLLQLLYLSPLGREAKILYCRVLPVLGKGCSYMLCDDMIRYEKIRHLVSLSVTNPPPRC